MKKLIFLALLISGSHLFAQETKNAVQILTEEDDPKCPPGYCPSANIYLDVFNFHKPRTGCSNGFGLCIKFEVSVTCHPCHQKTTYENGKAMAFINFSDGDMYLHLPAAIMQEKDYTPEDFSVFEIDQQSLIIRSSSGKTYSVKGGTYPVKLNDDELIVRLELD